MPLTAYCRKCKHDVAPGDVCPECGSPLTPASRHVAWSIVHRPVYDWFCWNSAARFAIPTLALLALMVFLPELLVHGTEGLTQLLQGGLPGTLLTVFIAAVLLWWLLLALQGEDILDCVVDSKGVHVMTWLTDPTPFRLLLRFRSPAMMAQVTGDETPVICIRTQEIAWKDVARIDLWPEKLTMMLYAPSYWLRLALPIEPYSWEDALEMTRGRVGKKKNVLLPPELIVRKTK